MQEKIPAIAIPFNETSLAQTTLLRLGEMSNVTAGAIEGAPALIFHKNLDFNSPSFQQDLANPENMVIVRFNDPSQIDVLLSALDRALKPFVEENVELDFNAYPVKQTLN